MIVYDRLQSTYRVLRHSELPPLAGERIIPADPRPADRILRENRLGIWRAGLPLPSACYPSHPLEFFATHGDYPDWTGVIVTGPDPRD